MKPQITAVICTYNRKDYLRRAVGSLVRQTLPREQFEILIVDNGSSDGTSLVASELQQQFDHEIRYVSEPALGVSNARNAGWRHASGKYVAYLDDDELAAPDWLENILTVFSTSPRDAACVGGKEVLLWESERPGWVPEQILYYLGHLDLSNDLMEIRGPSWLGGGNSAYQREILKKYGGFDTRLGRKGGSLLSMEDTRLQKKLVAAGCTIYYHPSIVIQNAVPSSRLTQPWFRRRAFWEGVSEAVACEYVGLKAAYHLSRGSLRSAAAILLRPKRFAAFVLPTKNPDCFLQKCVAWARFGYIYGSIARLFKKY
jgi:glycosyltransferase involved in cell wall biosynthesis